MTKDEIHIATTECLQQRRGNIENVNIFDMDQCGRDLFVSEHGLIVEELSQRGELEKDAYELSQEQKREPKSESEAVRLLRSIDAAFESCELGFDTCVPGVGSLVRRLEDVGKFLSRPPGPDWRQLLEALVSRIDDAAIAMDVTDGDGKGAERGVFIVDIHEQLKAARDAIAAEKGDS